MVNHHQVGEEVGDDIPTVYELKLEQHVPYIDPKKYGVNEKGVNPLDYFITSGDAVEKAKILERDLWKFAGEMRKKAYELLAEEKSIDIKEAQKLYRDGIRPEKPSRFGELVSAIWSAAGKSRSLLNNLIKVRGDNCFLETEWDNHSLLCITKNPRNKP